jgi:hypothetical protein
VRGVAREGLSVCAGEGGRIESIARCCACMLSVHAC